MISAGGPDPLELLGLSYFGPVLKIKHLAP